MHTITWVMSKTSRILSTILALFLLSMASERSLMAYADPGSGAMFVQIILAGIIGGLFRLRGFFSRFRQSATARERNILPQLSDDALTRPSK